MFAQDLHTLIRKCIPPNPRLATSSNTPQNCTMMSYHQLPKFEIELVLLLLAPSKDNNSLQLHKNLLLFQL
jgi:hypothetical protein